MVIASVVIIFFVFLAFGGTSGLFKLSVSPLPFKRSLSRPSLRPAAPILTNFWTTQNFIFLCLYRPHNGNCFSIFQFLVVFGPNGPRAGWETWSFQYRTPRSRSVIPSPHSFSAENVFLKKKWKLDLGFFESFGSLNFYSIRVVKLSVLSPPKRVL